VCLLALLASLPAAGQLTDSYTYGNRPIDKLPKSHYARPEDETDWAEPPLPSDHGLALHPKDLFRIGEGGLERLCVVEAWAPETTGQGAGYGLSLVERPDGVRWQTSPDWLGPNRRMRPYWLPVGSGGRQYLELAGPGGRGGMPAAAAAECDLADGAPEALIEAEPATSPHEADAGLALLSSDELLAVRGETLRLRVAVRPDDLTSGVSASLQPPHLRVAVRPDDLTSEVSASLQPPHLAPRTLARRPVHGMRALRLDTARWPGSPCELTVQVRAGDDILAERRLRVHLLEALPQIAFGARYADLRYTLPVTDGDTQRSWDDLWGGSGKRDVVVSFPGSDARFVFWRGASYVGCWALPEAWLTYEWLEAEPYFYGAVDCVEPIMDKDCRYSRAEIVASTPARTVVKWSYALMDFEQKIIRDEHAEEIFTFYPDGIGTRLLRGSYRSGWHETQEFIVINRPGRRPSQALDPQAITFLSPSGERQAPVWPKPGFSLDGWPQVISIVRLGNGPFPFMVTPDAPSQVKVWADPHLDKPDLFNCYPHWPVTRGMLTSWLTDPADFARPTHCNLANLVSAPIRDTPDEKDFVWLIGVSAEEQQALDAARCWLKPGRIEPLEGLASAEYRQVERAYVLRPADGARALRFTLVPDDGAPIVNPAFVIEGWEGPADLRMAGAESVTHGRERGKLVVSIEGRVRQRTEVEVG